MFYIRAFVNSLYNLKWLENNKKNYKKATNYFIFFILFLSFFYSGFTTFIFVPKIQNQIKINLAQLPDFELQIKDQKISISGIEQPFQKIINQDLGEPELFIFIDTVNTSSDYLSFSFSTSTQNRIIITSSSLAFFSSDGESAMESTEKFSDLILNKNKIISFFDNTKIIFIFSLILFFVSFTFIKLINLSLVTLVVYVVCRRKNKELEFKNIFASGLFALTGPSLFVAFLAIFDLSIVFLYSFLLFLNLFFIFDNEKIEEEKIIL